HRPCQDRADDSAPPRLSAHGSGASGAAGTRDRRTAVRSRRAGRGRVDGTRRATRAGDPRARQHVRHRGSAHRERAHVRRDHVPHWPTVRERIAATSPPASGARRVEMLPVVVQGGERWLSLSAVPFPGGTVYAFRDMTEEHAVEQLKSDFVSTVSHELRTPLAAVYGAALTLQ